MLNTISYKLALVRLFYDRPQITFAPIDFGLKSECGKNVSEGPVGMSTLTPAIVAVRSAVNSFEYGIDGAL
jgi:hypothetical protein